MNVYKQMLAWLSVWTLERGANDLHMVRLMPLPPRRLLLQQNPEWFILLVPAYPGCPGKKAVKRWCGCVCPCVSVCVSVRLRALTVAFLDRFSPKLAQT